MYLSKEWCRGFLVRHPTLKAYWSKPLERSRANGANPTSVGEFFDAAGEVLEQRPVPIPKSNRYGVDESGFNLGLTGRKRVIGPRGRKGQFNRADGKRENITTIETICADGTSLKPTIIFKGKHLMSKWGVKNPCDARIGCSRKGYTNNELAVEYLHDFHEQTKDKNDLPRALFLDGHASHCSLTFIETAINYNIEILAYPSHSTQLLQGLDVACFGPMKLIWNEVKERMEREGCPVTKDNFAEVYAEVRERALTASTIKSAFRATGIEPFNPNILTEDQLAPSLDSSIFGGLPFAMPSPVKAIMDAYKIINAPPHTQKPGTDQSHMESPLQRAKLMKNLLSQTSARFLVSNSPIKSTESLPSLLVFNPSIFPTPDFSIIDDPEPGNIDELAQDNTRLKAELAKAKIRDEKLTYFVEGANAQMVLQNMHTDELMKRLNEKEKKEGGVGQQHRLNVKGIDRRLLTGHNWVTAMRMDEEEAREAAEHAEIARKEKAECAGVTKWRQEERAGRKRDYEEAMQEWEEGGNVGLKPKKAKKAATPLRFKKRKIAAPVAEDDDVFIVPAVEVIEEDDEEWDGLDD